MEIWAAMLAVYMIARKRNWKLSEWLEILMAGVGLFLILHL